LIDLKEIKNKILIKENLFFLLIILIIFALDRYSKIEIIKNFSEDSFYYNNFLNFDLIWNTGIGFGLFSSDSAIFYNIISGIIILVIIFLIIVALAAQKFDKIIFSIIIGGACGNFYDRLIYNAVPDFIDLHYNNFHWFTFNVADIFISIGILIFLIRNFFTEN
tara:strand:+ start:253 stop:744 length:492 start_codon:yes stop_codon:yes gene_type:complete